MLEEIVNNNDNKKSKLVKKALKLLDLPDSLVEGPVKYDKDPRSLIRYRNEIGSLLNDLNKKLQ